ncbi:ribonuclease H1, partial [Carabus blaptoides fortunei]
TDSPRGPSEYRPISVASVPLRHFHKIIAHRITSCDAFDDRQRAFIKSDGACENVAVLSAILANSRSSLRELHITTLDMAKAFDTISHHALAAVALKRGLPPGLIDYIGSLYESASTRLEVRGQLSDPVREDNPRPLTPHLGDGEVEVPRHRFSPEAARQGVPDNYLQTAKSYLDNRWTSLEYATGKTVKKQITKGCPQGSRSGPGYWKILYGTLFEEQLPEGRIHPADIADFEYNSEAINCTKAVKIYTDGSRTRNGAGAAFVAFCSEEEIGHGKERIGPLSTALQGELRAIQMGVQYALTKAGVMKECAILTDCKAALEKIRGLRKPTETVINIRELIQEAKTRGMQVTWFWVKAHKKDKGNARADELAKQAANDREAMVGFDRIPTSVIKSKTKAELRQKWQARWKDGATGRTTANFIPTVNIGEKIRTKITYQVTQLITDHGNMGAYLYYRKLAAQPMCECEGGRENSEHILNMLEVRRLAEKIKWWETLAAFAAKVERLSTDGNSGTDREGSGSESTAAKQREERRREWRARTDVAGYSREDRTRNQPRDPRELEEVEVDGYSSQEGDHPQWQLPDRSPWGSAEQDLDSSSPEEGEIPQAETHQPNPPTRRQHPPQQARTRRITH